jgi:hypothetical protein
MFKRILNHKITLIGVVLGAIAGYIYYLNWGCTSGCSIKSSSLKITLYFAVMGGLIFNIIQSKLKK